MQDILEYDHQHVWHPYTSATNPLPVYEVASAQGCKLKLADGRELIDGMSSWWATIHGYNHPAINNAINQQVAKMSHVMFGGITHQPAVELARKLVDITPEPLQWVFFCDSGSVSVEVAMKMALQYQASIGQKQRTKFATIRGGYHGDTWHAMSVCDPATGMHHIFNGSLPIHYFAPRPQIAFDDEWHDDDLTPMQQLIDKQHNELAAIIIEPIVQGAGGMWFYHPTYLEKLREACNEHGILLIADEIATGFGRTGKLFACEHANISPDIMCLGKAITGGYMTFAATLTTRQIAEGISQGEAGVFMHGPTFMGNPLACAVANTSINLLLSSPWQQNIKTIEQQLLEGLSSLKNSDKVMAIRCLGAIGVVELKQPVDMAVIQKMFVDRGVWVRPFGRLIYLMPPFVISRTELQQLIDAVRDVIITL